MTTTASNPSRQISKSDRITAIYGSLQIALIATATAIAVLLVFAPDARLALLAPPGLVTAGLVAVCAGAAACAPSARRHRRITLTVVGHWLVWTAPAVTWTLIGRYPIGDAADVLILACAAGVLTTEAAPALVDIHHRQPSIIEAADVDEWLAPDTAQDRLLALARRSTDEPFDCWPVSKRVNSPRNDDPDLLRPLDAETGR